jgi:hypothetical protein
MLAERLHTRAVDTTVYKSTGAFTTLRQLAKTHVTIVQDTGRVQSRWRALFRSREIAATKTIYAARHRAAWLDQLPASSRGAAELLYAQYDALTEVRARAYKDFCVESHPHPMAAVLESCPGLGGIRVAQLLSAVVPPERFRTRWPFGSSGGLGIVLRSSSDFVRTPGGGWARAPVTKTHGPNRDHNTRSRRSSRARRRVS